MLAMMWPIWKPKNDSIFRENWIVPQKTINQAKEICNFEAPIKQDKEIIISKKISKRVMNSHSNRFIICSDAAFSIKHGKFAFGSVIFS